MSPPHIRFTPIFILSITSLLALCFAAFILFVATNRPWMGLELRAYPADNSLKIMSIAPDGPAGEMRSVGTLLKISSLHDAPIELVASDLIEEPDMLPTYLDMVAFFDRQDAFGLLLKQRRVELTVKDLDGAIFRVNIIPEDVRPIADLPAVFWAQLLVAVSGLLIGLWVFLLKPDWPAAFFAIVGVGLATAAGAAAIYSTRELTIGEGYFAIFSQINHFGGTLLFGFGMIALFSSYPRQLFSKKYLLIFFVVSASWYIADFLYLLDSPVIGNHLWVVIQMLVIIILIVIQYFATKGDPSGRAVLKWLGLSAILGTGAFVLVSTLPALLHLNSVISQGYAFLLFLIIYIGVALGVSRYRLFELDEWAFRIMFYLGGAAILVILDAILILVLALDDMPAFSLSVISVALLYLPFRDSIGRLFRRRKVSNQQELFNDVVDVAYAPSTQQQNESWKALVQRLFNPLSADFEKSAIGNAQMFLDGLVMQIPAVKTIPSIKLEYAHAGRKLFSRSDIAKVQEMVVMLGHLIENRFAHEKGVSEERQRIARDMHDNIGAQLLSALHSKKAERKDVMIRETITDLRDIINNASSHDLTFDEILADLRVETAERLAAADMELKWVFNADDTPPLDPHTIHTLRSIIREVVSNAIKHAKAKHLFVTWDWAEDTIKLGIKDDGVGIISTDSAGRAGLANIEARTKSLDGKFLRLPNDPGASFEIQFPI